ncbi:MAG TPA: hypothetical protein VK421_14365 [Pyrinomonadaceae bacterium]|nr:hypothetical protein [Pyrinomonadaceae bacterium]
MDSDLFEPYERLIEIELLGRAARVPENNRLLRCFQFLSLRSISYGDFCWNGDCTNCQFWYREPGDDPRAPEKTALSCRFTVLEGMKVTRLHPCVRLEGVNAPGPAQNAAADTARAAERDLAAATPPGDA